LGNESQHEKREPQFNVIKLMAESMNWESQYLRLPVFLYLKKPAAEEHQTDLLIGSHLNFQNGAL
jgi:hypothetical protein